MGASRAWPGAATPVLCACAAATDSAAAAPCPEASGLSDSHATWRAVSLSLTTFCTTLMTAPPTEGCTGAGCQVSTMRRLSITRPTHQKVFHRQVFDEMAGRSDPQHGSRGGRG